MTRNSIREYATALRERYRKSTKQQKKFMLDEFCQTTGYHRKAAIRLLGADPPERGKRRGRPRTYGPEATVALKTLWEAADRICSKRLVDFVPELLEVLERNGELRLSPEVRQQVLAMSAATIDRRLKGEQVKRGRQPYSQSRSSASLKAQIPIRTFGEWQEVQPGAFQGDLVLHCGETTAGFHLTTLVIVDVATGWSDYEVVWGKAQERVGGAVERVRRRLPIEVREFHTDNGGEFINEVLYPYCQRRGIKLTRGRPYKKNDQAYAEQKNWSVVRRLIGYDRYSSKAAMAKLNEVYDLLRLYVNYFQPIRKLVGKVRDGAKVKKRYDKAQTPYRRLVTSGVLTSEQSHQLNQIYRRLNPVQLRAEIDKSLEALWRVADRGVATKQVAATSSR